MTFNCFGAIISFFLCRTYLNDETESNLPKNYKQARRKNEGDTSRPMNEIFMEIIFPTFNQMSTADHRNVPTAPGC